MLFAAGAAAGVIVVVAVVLLLVQLFGSDKIAMATMGVKEVSPAQEPELHGIIERLCVQADLPKPRVCVMETSMPNACAMGRSKKSTTVCATRGILELLSPAELEGVMAHELTHVINRDVMVMTLASFFATLASLIAQFALFFGGGFGGGYGRSRDEEEGIIFVLLVSVLVYAISFLLLRALSRYREFAADRGSAVLTGRPSALASALLKISGTMERVPSQDLRKSGRDERLLHRARAHEAVADEHLRRPPAAGAAPGRAGTAGVPAAGHRLTVGLRDILTGRHEVKGPAPDRLFAITTAYVTLQAEHQIEPAGKRRDRLPGARHERVRKHAARNGRGRDGHRRGERHDGLHRGRQLRLPLDGAAQPRGRAQRGRSGGGHQRGLQLDRDRRPRRAPAVRRVRLRGRAAKRRDLLHLQLQARLLVSVRARGRQAPSERSTERELQIKAQMASELPIEPELERWFPLWGIPI